MKTRHNPHLHDTKKARNPDHTCSQARAQMPMEHLQDHARGAFYEFEVHHFFIPYSYSSKLNDVVYCGVLVTYLVLVAGGQAWSS